MRISDWSSDVCSSDLLIVAGGMESMTNAPYLLKKHRGGARIGHDTAYDHMFLDGLEDAYEAGRAMGTFAQDTADAYQLSRQAQDDYSIESLKRAQAAIASGAFAGEIAPVTLTTRKGEVRSEEHTSELQSLMRISYAVFCLKKK